MEKITKGEIPSNDVLVNRTLITAANQINNGNKIVAEAEAELVGILNYTRDDVNRDLYWANKTALAGETYRTHNFLEAAAYKSSLIQAASTEFFKEKFMTYDYGEITLQAIEKLEKLVENNGKDELWFLYFPKSCLFSQNKMILPPHTHTYNFRDKF